MITIGLAPEKLQATNLLHGARGLHSKNAIYSLGGNTEHVEAMLYDVIEQPLVTSENPWI